MEVPDVEVIFVLQNIAADGMMFVLERSYVLLLEPLDR